MHIWSKIKETVVSISFEPFSKEVTFMAGLMAHHNTPNEVKK